MHPKSCCTSSKTCLSSQSSCANSPSSRRTCCDRQDRITCRGDSGVSLRVLLTRELRSSRRADPHHICGGENAFDSGMLRQTPTSRLPCHCPRRTGFRRSIALRTRPVPRGWPWLAATRMIFVLEKCLYSLSWLWDDWCCVHHLQRSAGDLTVSEAMEMACRASFVGHVATRIPCPKSNNNMKSPRTLMRSFFAPGPAWMSCVQAEPAETNRSRFSSGTGRRPGKAQRALALDAPLSSAHRRSDPSQPRSASGHPSQPTETAPAGHN